VLLTAQVNQPYTCTLRALGRNYIKCNDLYISFLKDNLNILYTLLQNTEEMWKYN